MLFKQKTAYEMESRDWSSDVCSSDLACDDADAGYNDTSVYALKGRLGAILGGVRVP